MLISDELKIAWVYGYLKANFDMFTEMGYHPDVVGKSMHFITEKALSRLGITNSKLCERIINQIDGLDLELTIAKVIEENREKSNGKSFTVSF